MQGFNGHYNQTFELLHYYYVWITGVDHLKKQNLRFVTCSNIKAAIKLCYVDNICQPYIHGLSVV